MLQHWLLDIIGSESRKGRLSLPQILWIIRDPVFFEEGQELFLESHLPMVRLLVPNQFVSDQALTILCAEDTMVV